jgi:hypothetical protein
VPDVFAELEDDMIVIPTMKKVSARKHKGTAAGRELIAAMKEVHRAVTTGD